MACPGEPSKLENLVQKKYFNYRRRAQSDEMADSNPGKQFQLGFCSHKRTGDM
jgi:hypothetical protein